MCERKEILLQLFRESTDMPPTASFHMQSLPLTCVWSVPSYRSRSEFYFYLFIYSSIYEVLCWRQPWILFPPLRGLFGDRSQKDPPPPPPHKKNVRRGVELRTHLWFEDRKVMRHAGIWKQDQGHKKNKEEAADDRAKFGYRISAPTRLLMEINSWVLMPRVLLRKKGEGTNKTNHKTPQDQGKVFLRSLRTFNIGLFMLSRLQAACLREIDKIYQELIFDGTSGSGVTS